MISLLKIHRPHLSWHKINKLLHWAITTANNWDKFYKPSWKFLFEIRCSTFLLKLPLHRHTNTQQANKLTYQNKLCTSSRTNCWTHKTYPTKRTASNENIDITVGNLGTPRRGNSKQTLKRKVKLSVLANIAVHFLHVSYAIEITSWKLSQKHRFCKRYVWTSRNKKFPL